MVPNTVNRPQGVKDDAGYGYSLYKVNCIVGLRINVPGKTHVRDGSPYQRPSAFAFDKVKVGICTKTKKNCNDWEESPRDSNNGRPMTTIVRRCCHLGTSPDLLVCRSGSSKAIDRVHTEDVGGSKDNMLQKDAAS